MKTSNFFGTKSNFLGIFIVSIISVLFLPDCKKVKDYLNQNKSRFLVMSNGKDPMIVQIKVKDTTIDVFGTKDESGNPVNLTDLIVKKPRDTTYYKFDAEKMLSSITTQNGTKFIFRWTSAQKAAVTVLANDGITQLTTEVNFSSSTSLTTSTPSIQKRPNTNLTLSFIPGTQSPHLNAFSSSYNALINVTQCSYPTNGDVYLVATSTSDETLGVFPAQQITKGQFGVSLPSNIAPIIKPGEICANIVNVLGIGCIGTQMPGLPLLCPALAAAVSLSGIGTLVAAPIFEGCTAAVAGLELYCKTIGNSPSPNAPSLASEICSSPFIDRAYTADVILYAYVVGVPHSSYSFSVRTPGNGPYPTLTINLNSETTIRNLELTPSVPVARQQYVANVDVFCLLPGSTVKISVVGTDGYTNSVTSYISSTTTNGTFSLTVPGALTSGIRDLVTLQITLPNGTVLKRTAFLIFA